MATIDKNLLKSDNFWQYLKENFLIVEEVTELLGVTKWAVLKRTKSGDIPAYKYGKRWYIRKDELLDSMTGGFAPTPAA